MNDTQWPRYEVFKQDKPHKPHEAVGTVHAPDPEMALQNARDVYVRRPDCHSLWVAPEDAVFKMTAYELEQDPNWHVETIPEDAPEEIYLVFTRQHHRRSMVAASHVGEVQARTPREALRRAMEQAAWTSKPVYLWWIVPQAAITASQEEDVPSMFAPALDKTYRDQSYYKGILFGKHLQKKHAKSSPTGKKAS